MDRVAQAGSPPPSPGPGTAPQPPAEVAKNAHRLVLQIKGAATSMLGRKPGAIDALIARELPSMIAALTVLHEASQPLQVQVHRHLTKLHLALAARGGAAEPLARDLQQALVLCERRIIRRAAADVARFGAILKHLAAHPADPGSDTAATAEECLSPQPLAVKAPFRAASKDTMEGLTPLQRDAMLDFLHREGVPEAEIRTFADLISAPLPDTGKPALRFSALVTEADDIVYTQAVANGSFGRFHEGWDVRNERECAVKQLRVGSEHSAAAASGKVLPTSEPTLIEELAVMERVGSPLAAGVVLTRGFKHYLVGRLYDGDLIELATMDSDPARAAVATAATAQAAAELQRAHAVGVIHRDIKPENLLWAGRGPDAGTFVVADWGLATLVDPAKGTADAAGTWVTLPREALRGALTRAADIYSLGATQVAVVTGKYPIADEAVESGNGPWIEKEHDRFQAAIRALPRDPATGLIDVVALARSGGRLADMAACGAAVATFVLDRMMADDPVARPTAAEVVAFFAEHDPEAIRKRAAEATAGFIRSRADYTTRMLQKMGLRAFASVRRLTGGTLRPKAAAAPTLAPPSLAPLRLRAFARGTLPPPVAVGPPGRTDE